MEVQLLLLTSLILSPIVDVHQLTYLTGYPKQILGHGNNNEMHSGEYLQKILNGPKEMSAVSTEVLLLQQH
jgi:hypothetical protein